MSDYDIATQKRIVRENTALRGPCYLGRDPNGYTHWYDLTGRGLAVVDGDSVAATGHLDEIEADNLRDYADAVAREAGGWAAGPMLVSEHSTIDRTIAVATRR